MRERDDNLVLLVTDGAKVFAQISQSRSGVDDSDAIRVGERDLQAGSVAAELLEPRIANRDGAARTVKLELHRQRIIPVATSFDTKISRSHLRWRMELSPFNLALLPAGFSESPGDNWQPHMRP